MLTTRNRQRSARLYFWLALLCFAIFAMLAVYALISRPSFQPDQNLMQELQHATLDEPADVAALPGPWPQWLGPKRNGVSTESGLAASWPENGPSVLWRAKSGPGYSSLAVGGGRAYTLLQDGNDEVVVCWHSETGEELWRERCAAKFQTREASGPRSTPCLDGDRLYTVGAAGLFQCREASNGKLRWEHNLLKEFNAPNLRWGVCFSPLVDGDLVFTNPGGPNGNSVAAFNKHTGAPVWKALDDPAGYSSPLLIHAAGRKQVLFFTGAALVSLAPEDGQLLWRIPWPTPHAVNSATPMWLQARAGEKVMDYVFISSGYGVGCALLKVTADANGTIQARRVYASNQLRNHFATSVFYRGHIYGIDDPDALTCLDVKTGQVLWRQRGAGKGSLLAADGHLIMLEEQGRLVMVEATPEGYHEEALWQALNGRCWTVPALADGRLYLRDETEVLCLTLAK
jgi:outer membrane protein assembly factor BamB